MALIVAAAGCLGTEQDRVLGITATGTVEGVVFFDANGDRALDLADVPQPDVGVRLLVDGTRDTLVRVTSDAAGGFVVSLPVGSYNVAVDSATVADSVEVVKIDPTSFRVQLDDTVTALIALSFPKLTIAEARALPPGEWVFVEGTTVTGRATFGDRSVHLASATGAMRVTRVRPSAVLPNDSVRMVGRIVIENGQPTLNDATPFLIAVVDPVDPEAVTTAAADTADGGRLDAALVEVTAAAIQDTSTVADGFVLSVDDGSGVLELLLDSDVPFTNLAAYVPGAELDAQGVLVPTAGGATWQLKPRFDADLTVK